MGRDAGPRHNSSQISTGSATTVLRGVTLSLNLTLYDLKKGRAAEMTSLYDECPTRPIRHMLAAPAGNNAVAWNSCAEHMGRKACRLRNRVVGTCLSRLEIVASGMCASKQSAATSDGGAGAGMSRSKVPERWRGCFGPFRPPDR